MGIVAVLLWLLTADSIRRGAPAWRSWVFAIFAAVTSYFAYATSNL